MDRDKRIKLTTDYPQMKCLRCTNLMIYPQTPTRTVCTAKAEPLTCGRKFNPKDGGDMVAV